MRRGFALADGCDVNGELHVNHVPGSLNIAFTVVPILASAGDQIMGLAAGRQHLSSKLRNVAVDIPATQEAALSLGGSIAMVLSKRILKIINNASDLADRISATRLYQRFAWHTNFICQLRSSTRKYSPPLSKVLKPKKTG